MWTRSTQWMGRAVLQMNWSSLRNNNKQLRFKTSGKFYRSSSRNLFWNMPQINKGTPKHVHFTQETESPWLLHFKQSHWWEKAEPVQVRFTLRLRDRRSMWMQDGCRVYVDSYMASNGSCFMVTWTSFKNHLLEVDLTRNRDTMALWTLTTIDFFYFVMREDLHE